MTVAAGRDARGEGEEDVIACVVQWPAMLANRELQRRVGKIYKKRAVIFLLTTTIRRISGF